ncbi:MAG: hypothetical protein K2X87_23805 [Gemmataceae bacterium]|nr:hypothetical protein [Gemmataceae bacterium]
MTEAEWFAATDRDILDAAYRLNPRRQRLLAVAGCRLMGHLIDYPSAHAALETVEVFADTGRSKAALRRARQALQTTRNGLRPPGTGGARVPDGGAVRESHAANELTLFAVQVAATENAVAHALWHVMDGLVTVGRMPADTVRRRTYGLYRDIVGPGPAVAFDPEWRTSTAVALARGMYDGRDFAAMPILADALQDAGCEDEQVLGHCRDPQAAHVRGCWAVDLVLGKS